MLLFYPVSARDPDPPVLAAQGVSAPNGGVRLWKTFEALPEEPGPVLVVGSDIPDVRAHHVARAFRALGAHVAADHRGHVGYQVRDRELSGKHSR